MTSTDGFCSTIIFEPGELGETHPGPAPSTVYTASYSRPSPSTSATPAFPPPTPPLRATSPSGSNSTSSVATLPGFASATTKIPTVPLTALSAPSPTSIFAQPTIIAPYSGSNRNPSVSSTGSAPLSTPPETPIVTATFSHKREGDGAQPKAEEPKSKKRRVAPTLIKPVESQR